VSVGCSGVPASGISRYALLHTKIPVACTWKPKPLFRRELHVLTIHKGTAKWLMSMMAILDPMGEGQLGPFQNLSCKAHKFILLVKWC
jgi:hypothetical protein